MNKLEIYVSTLLSNSIGFFFNFIMFLLFYNFFEKESTGFIQFIISGSLPFLLIFLFYRWACHLSFPLLYVVAKDITQDLDGIYIHFYFFFRRYFISSLHLNQRYHILITLILLRASLLMPRRIMMEQSPPDFKLFGFDYGYAIILLIIGLIFLNKLGSKAAEKL